MSKRTTPGLFVACVIAVVVGLASASPALAEVPVWWIGSYSVPAELPPGGDGEIIVDTNNLGTANMSGIYELTDKLPHGLTVTSINHRTGFCKTEVIESFQTVKCISGQSFTPYEEADLRINVSVAEEVPSSAVNVASISGGGAAADSSSETLRFGSAQPAFGVDRLEQLALNEDGTPDTQAGSHPFEYTTTLQLNEQLKVVEGVNGKKIAVRAPALAKDLHFNLPQGLIGNATVVPQCTVKQFSTFVPGKTVVNECPTDAVVGVADVKLVFENEALFVSLFTPSPVFNLTPAAGEPARFAFDVGGVPIYLDTSVKTGSDYGIVVSVNDTNTQLELTGSQVTFWGVPSDPRHDQSRGWACIAGGLWEEVYGGALGGCLKSRPNTPLGAPLLTMPTSCTGPLQSSIEADSWAQPGVFQKGEYTWHDASGPLQMDGCDRLPFTPSIKVTPDGPAASTPTGLTVDEHVPQDTTINAEGLAESDVKGLSVALPEGVALNPSAADGLQACSEEQIELHSGAAPACPEASKVATVKVKTPLLPEPLEGAAYLATQDANPFGSLVALYLYAEDPVSGIHVKAAGEVLENPVTGQLTAHFERDPSFGGASVSSQFLPQLAFEDVELHFFGGERAPLGTPAHCGAYTATGTFTPWSESGTREASSTFNIGTGPNGSLCPGATLPFAPSLTAGTTSIQAGGFSPFTTTMSREDGNQNLQAIQLKMPPGLLGLLSSVKLCGETEANAGTCGAETQIGETIVGVGLGGDPYSVKGGKVYITGPYNGAPFGLSIVNPAVAGPFNLGKVVVRAKIEVNPQTAELTITTDDSGPYAIPHILDGIPLQIQHVNVTINRPGFTFNPTNCSPLAITGAVTSVEGASENLSVPFQATNCATLGFKPGFTVATSGKTSRLDGASLSAKLVNPNAPFGSQANVALVKVELPKQLPSRLTTLQKACTAAQFNSNPAACPAASKIGYAVVHTPLVPVPLEGPAIFVSHGDEAFPSLTIVLQGYGVTVELVGDTLIRNGVTSTTFKTVPDTPFSSFDLTLPQGPFSALTANGNLCALKRTVTVEKRVTVKVHERKRSVTRKVKHMLARTLQMPTEFIAQNGAAIDQNTPITVTGCAKAKPARKAKHKRR